MAGPQRISTLSDQNREMVSAWNATRSSKIAPNQIETQCYESWYVLNGSLLHLTLIPKHHQKGDWWIEFRLQPAAAASLPSLPPAFHNLINLSQCTRQYPQQVCTRMILPRPAIEKGDMSLLAALAWQRGRNDLQPLLLEIISPMTSPFEPRSIYSKWTIRPTKTNRSSKPGFVVFWQLPSA